MVNNRTRKEFNLKKKQNQITTVNENNKAPIITFIVFVKIKNLIMFR